MAFSVGLPTSVGVLDPSRSLTLGMRSSSSRAVALAVAVFSAAPAESSEKGFLRTVLPEEEDGSPVSLEVGEAGESCDPPVVSGGRSSNRGYVSPSAG